MRNRSRGNALASALVTGAIILLAIVGWMLWARPSDRTVRPDGLGVTTPGAVRAQALDTGCRSNLGQIRQAIQMVRIDDEEAIVTLDGLRLPTEVLRCPIGKEPYYLDEAGQVHCPHPGHEGL